MNNTRTVKVLQGTRLPWPHGGVCRAVMTYRGNATGERCPVLATQEVKTSEKERVPLCYTHAGRAQLQGELLIISEVTPNA